MLLRPFPLTPDKLKEFANGRDFMTMQYVVLEVRARGAGCVYVCVCWFDLYVHARV